MTNCEEHKYKNMLNTDDIKLQSGDLHIDLTSIPTDVFGTPLVNKKNNVFEEYDNDIVKYRKYIDVIKYIEFTYNKIVELLCPCKYNKKNT